ncbi:MAG: sulfatase [Acidobacteriota bacterium]
MACSGGPYDPGASEEKSSVESTEPWQRIDLWVHEPTVEQASGSATAWSRSVVNLGRIEVRPGPFLTGFHLANIPQLAASEVRALTQRRGTQLRWTLALGETPWLRFVPLRNESYPSAQRYRVEVRNSAGEITPLYNRVLDVAPPPSAAAEYLDLSPFAGETIDLLFSVDVPPPPGDPRGAARLERVPSAAGRIPGTVDPQAKPGFGVWASPAIYHRGPNSASRPTGASEGEDDSWTAPGSPEQPNVLFIGADTLRIDALGAWGASPSVTPALDALAEESDLWTHCVSTFNATNPSFASIFTGLYGKNHRVYNLQSRVPDASQTLAESFDEVGYDTLAIISARHLGDHNSGLAQGFDDVTLTGRHFSAEVVVDMAMDWIAQRQEPFFAWLHFFDPHTPHTAPAPFSLGFAPETPSGVAPVDDWRAVRPPGWPGYEDGFLAGHYDLYQGEVAYLDRQLDRLLDFLASRDLMENTIVVFVADHGEHIGDRGTRYGHHGLFENTTRVPLMIRWPAPPGQGEGRRFGGLVQTIDLFPTLLNAVGLELPEQDGIDLRELTNEERNGRRVAFSEHSHWQGVRVRTERWAYMKSAGSKYVEDGTYLFDLQQDPDERENLANQGLEIQEELERIITAWLQDTRDTEAPLPADLSEEDLQQLRSLGYGG